jgi:hypothetical protein
VIDELVRVEGGGHDQNQCTVSELAEMLAFWTLSTVRNSKLQSGARSIVVVKALCYKPEGRSFGTR